MMTTAERVAPRLKQRYRDEIRDGLQEQFGYGNVMQIPGVVKVVVNMGVGDAARDAKLIDGAVRDLATITGQKPQVRRATKSIAQFKLREGMPIGAKVTLRGDRMWEFLDRLLTIALPRIRDFRGLSPTQFDGRGNYTFGLTEQSMFHEINPDSIDRPRGMDITVVTTATTDEEGRALLRRLGLPVQGGVRWPRRPSSSRPRPSRSSRSAATPAARSAGVPARCCASSGCAASASDRWRTAASCPASARAAGSCNRSGRDASAPHSVRVGRPAPDQQRIAVGPAPPSGTPGSGGAGNRGGKVTTSP